MKKIAMIAVGVVGLGFFAIVAIAVINMPSAKERAYAAQLDALPVYGLPTPAGAVVAPPANQLQVINIKCGAEHGFIHIEGVVKNISSVALDSVAAVGVWSTADRSQSSSSVAMVEYQPLLPGQESPFKVMKTNNPLLNTCVLTFKHLLGGTIPTLVRY